MKIEVVNVVATANTGYPIDLPRLAKRPHITYNPSRYFCAYFKDDSMEAKVSIFASGKLIAVGARSEKSAELALKHTMMMLQESSKAGTLDADVTIQNVVITVDLGHKIDLESFQLLIPGTIFEPEQFPAAVIRPRSHTVSVLAFASGKLVIAGLKTTAKMKEAALDILEELELIS